MTTEPIAVEAPVKPLSALRSLAASLPSLPKPADKPPEPAAPKPADAEKSASPTPPPDPSRPGLFARTTKKQVLIGASAVFSVVAGAVSVRLLTPPDPNPPAAAQPVVPAAKPAPLPPAPEPGRFPPDTIPSQALPLVPAPEFKVPDAPAVPPTPPGGMRKPTVEVGIPAVGDPVPPGKLGDPKVEVVPKLGDPASGAFGTSPKPTAEPDLFGASGPGQIIPVVGNEPAKPPAAPPMSPAAPPALPALPTGGTGPAVPALPGAEAPKTPAAPGPLVPLPGPTNPADNAPKPPALPAPPVVPAVPPGDLGTPKPPPLPDPGDLTKPEPKTPPAPVVGSPLDKPKPIDPPAVVPPVPEKKADVPALPDLGPALPATPVKPVGAPDAGMKLEFTKPAGAAVERTERPPTTSYDVDIHYPKAGDTWEAVSREFYGDARYAAGLRAYNRNKPLQGGVDVPPLHVVRRYLANPPGAAVPSGAARTAEWGAAPAGRGGDKTFRVPPGGMTMRAVARLVLGSDQRWGDVHDLNPQHRADETLPAGTELRLPPDARPPG